RLREAANKDGLEVCYMENPNLRTGVCGVLITDHNRSLCTDLLAANTYDVCHVKQPENWAHIEKAKYYYVTGYFYTVSPETIELVAKHALEHKKTFTANLSAPFVPVAYTDALRRTIPYIDILFGNETEALAFAQAFDLGTTNLEKIAHAAANMPKHDSSRPRIVVFTHGNNPTIVAIQGEDVLKEYPVTYIPNEEIADTNGAGDAFVAGFLSQLLLERPLTDCIEAGNWLAGKVIREVGPTYPAGKLEFVPSQSIAPVLKKIDV
ncbi:adenosine kinase, partial [Spiromyces aspiralis]